MPTSNEIGDELEERAAEILGGVRVVQSGGGKFIKSDVKDGGGFIYSCKATRRIGDAAVRTLWKLWVEARKAARGPAGHGNEAKPAMIFEINGELLVLTKLSDHAALATGEIEPYIAPTKAQERRARAIRSPMEGNNGT